jgi:hypothetical protein
MPVTFNVLDETTAGERRPAGTFACASRETTLREIIRARVQQEVDRYNRSDTSVFQGLIQPGETERLLNRERPSHRHLDWEKQFEIALRAFEGNGFLVLKDNCQLTDLDQSVQLEPQTQITFLKLVPLIGG